MEPRSKKTAAKPRSSVTKQKSTVVKPKKADTALKTAAVKLNIMNIIPSETNAKLKAYVCKCGRMIDPKAKLSKCSQCGCVIKTR